jgi:DNA-binding NtrC family response regulator
MAGERVLVAEDDPLSREFLTRALELLDLDVTAVDDGNAAAITLAREPFEFVFTDLRMPGRDGMAVLAESKRLDADRPVILVTAHGTVDVAVAAMKRGADDVLEKPVTVDQLELAVLRARERRRILGENRRLRSENEADDDLVVLSPAMRALAAAVAKVAPSRATVLLRGESGTGKERVAALVHKLSDRSRGPYVKVNCAAIPAELLESEFFGHEKGAFTGADARREGRFEQADGGTLLLDEVGEIALPLQAKLLRVLQEGDFTRVGGSRAVRADVRVVASTNRELSAEVAAGRFRMDLFYRLNVVPLTVPPLRERPEEIAPLAEIFLARAAPTAVLTDDAKALLGAHTWPGNVRELENLMKRAALLARDGRADAALIAPWLGAEALVARPSGRAFVARTLASVERELIDETLAHFGGNRTKTAAALGISVRTLFNKLKEVVPEAVRTG